MMMQLMKREYPHFDSQNGRNKSAVILLLMKYKYALPNNRKWQEHVNHDHVAAHGMGLHTH